jgi:hypothetical protein
MYKECRLQLHMAPSFTYPFYIALPSSFITHIIKFPEGALEKRNKKIQKQITKASILEK